MAAVFDDADTLLYTSLKETLALYSTDIRARTFRKT